VEVKISKKPVPKTDTDTANPTNPSEGDIEFMMYDETDKFVWKRIWERNMTLTEPFTCNSEHEKNILVLELRKIRQLDVPMMTDCS
jgi:phenylalanine-4-hydroxylase